MKPIKFMITGALLILLGPIMSLVNFMFSEFMVLCWMVGIPLFIAGLVMPADGFSVPEQSDDLPQKECTACGKKHDFDYPVCPRCGHDYQPKQIK